MSKRRILVILMMVLAAAFFFVMHSRGMFGNQNAASTKGKYICPMHPAYISDRPGDCPICNMRLVPANSQSSGPAFQKDASADKYTCPMHPSYLSDKKGTCPICHMDLVPAKKGQSSSEKSEKAGAKYTCPMHPKYISDKPGICPICEMDLVEMKGTQDPSKKAEEKYTCAMHPQVISDKPGKCPICHMDLVPAKENQEGRDNTVTIGERGRELAGIQTVQAVSEHLQYTIRTVGMIVADETKVRHIHIKAAGWIEKLFINFSGQMVKKGEPLLTIYSPDLMTSQREFVEAKQSLQKGISDASIQSQREELFKSARKRLELFDIPESFIAELEKSGTVHRTVTMISPVTGFVTTKQVFEGQQIEPGTELFTVTDISDIWVEADFYEFESGLVKVGQEALLTSPYDPNLQFTGPVLYIYPYLNPVSRTLKARFKFNNPDFRLKLNMYLDVNLKIDTPATIVVPDSAILDSGIRRVVFVEVGSGKFEPRIVKVGIRNGGKAQILSGISAGETVVVKGNFLLDSEARLRSAIGEK